MADRDPNAKVNITLRIPEWLRSQLEASAKSRDQSINGDINQRLMRSFEVGGLVGKLDAIVGSLASIEARLTTIEGS